MEEWCVLWLRRLACATAAVTFAIVQGDWLHGPRLHSVPLHSLPITVIPTDLSSVLSPY